MEVKIISAILIMSLLITGEVVTQTFHTVVVLKKNSRITIDGTSNITKFRFTQNCEDFIDRCLPLIVTQDGNRLYLNKNELFIPVKGFNSKNKLALRDFYKLLDVDNHPAIGIQLQYIEMQPQDNGLVYAAIYLTIAGVTQGYTIPVKVLRDGEDYIFSVIKDIDILDFGLTPPTHVMHIVKISEWININMVVTCKIVL